MGKRELPVKITDNAVIEWAYPFLIGSAAALVVFLLAPTPNKECAEKLATAAITVAAIFIGFLATTKTILISMRSDKFMQSLRDSGCIKKLGRYVGWAIITSALLIVFYMLTYVTFGPKLWCLWLFAAFLSATTFFRVAALQLKLIGDNRHIFIKK